MLTTSIGSVQASLDGGLLTLTDGATGGGPIRLDADGMQALVDFLVSAPARESNIRQAYRVAVRPMSGLTARLQVGLAASDVVPISISVLGIFIGPLPGTKLSLSMDQEVVLSLEFEGRGLTLRGIVCRQDSTGCGLLFPGSLKGEELDPPPLLSRIVMELQRRAVAERLQIAKSVTPK